MILSTVVLNNVWVFEKNMIFRSLVLNIEKLNQLQLGHPKKKKERERERERERKYRLTISEWWTV